MTRGTQALLIEILAILALINAVAALQNGQALSVLPSGVSYPPALRIGAAALWALLFLVLLIGVWRRPHRTVRYVPPALTLYGVWGLGWLVIFARADYDQGRIGFQAALTIILVAPIWVLCRKRGALINR